MSGTLSPSPRFVGLSDTGVPLSGGLLYTYLTGTLTPATTYSDSALTVPNANPIVLDAGGRATIYLSAASYKFVLKTSAGVTVYTADPVTSVASGLVSGLGEVFVFGGDPNTPVVLAAYPTGAALSAMHGGTALFNIDSATLDAGTYVIEATGFVVAAATLTVAIVDLDSGVPDTPLATAAITSTAGERVVSGSITFAAGGLAHTYAIKVKCSQPTGGYAFGIRLKRTA